MSFKKYLLLSIVLHVRKIVIILLVILALFGGIVYFIANSPLVISKIADNFAPDYNITYSRIYGNVVTGIEIEDLAYNKMPLSKHIVLKWNPNGLIKRQIIINSIVLNSVNIDTFKNLTASFSNNLDKNNSSGNAFSFSLALDKVDIDIYPFTEHNVYIKNISLNAQNIYYDSDTLDIENVDFKADTNVTKLFFKAHLKKQIVDIEELKLKDFDTLAMENLLNTQKKHTKKKQDKNKTIAVSQSQISPKRVIITKLEANFLPRFFNPLDIKDLSLKISNANIDLSDYIVRKGSLSLSADTNFAKLNHEGNIKDNHLLGDFKLYPKKELFKTYKLGLREEAFSKITIGVDATKKRIIANLDTQLMQLLKANKSKFNIDVNNLKSKLTYVLANKVLRVDSVASISTPYAKKVELTNFLVRDKNITYKGDINISQITGIDEKLKNLLYDFKVNYKGDTKSINTKILSKMLKGSFVSNDFKKGFIHIENIEPLLLRDYTALPYELNETKADVELDMPFSFENNASYDAKVHIKSNVLNIDSNVSYKDDINIDTVTNIPEKSLLNSYDKAIKWNKVMPIHIKSTIKGDKVESYADLDTLHINSIYDLNTTKVKGDISIDGFYASIKGETKAIVNIDSSIYDISSFTKSISRIYALNDLPHINGNANLFIKINRLKKIDLSLQSSLISYYTNKKETTDIKDINCLVNYEDGNISIAKYRLTYNKEKIYASKPSKIVLYDGIIAISPFWVDDKLKLFGYYNTKTKLGNVISQSKNLHITNKIIDFDSKINIETKRDGNRTNIQGEVVLSNGDVHYDISQKRFASDSDIIIIQNIKKDKKSIFMDNLSADIQIKTKKPLVYSKDAIHIKANVDVSLHKEEHSNMMLLGYVEIMKGGTYIFQNKKFTLDKSRVYFTGSPNKPILDIKVHYKTINYLVTISVTGTPNMPNITFSSTPKLSKEQILSLILFDTKVGAGTNTGDEMMRMMGGAIAKSALSNIGVKIDHLVLGKGNSIEVGKKLTDKITIIYVNDVVSKVKLKYEYNPYIEGVIGASEQSQSYDIIYKKDF